VHCLVSGFVNKENMRYRAMVNRRVLHEQPFQSSKVAVWCAVGTSVLWVHFYLKMVTARALHHDSAQLPASAVASTWCTFQQDGNAAHTAGRSLEVVRILFHRVISRFGDIQRPVLSRSLRSQTSFCGDT
jgi:hypothetical protein